MNEKRKIIAISGSTRSNSSNLNLIMAISNLTKNKFDIEIFKELTEIPHFNPDLDSNHPPVGVMNFRSKLQKSDGILICTPEYAMGVPGTLKNAIDWTVSSMEFSNKPTALITASSMGQKGHESLLETLKIIEAKITDETQLLISFAQIRISNDYKITDTTTLNQINKLIYKFEELLANEII